MKTRFCIATATVVACAGAVHAGGALEAFYGWEDGGTVLGSYGNFHSDYNTDPDYVMSGNGSLHIWEDPLSGTPQGYVAWITGLSDGDVIDASFFAYDESPGTSPGLRIWGHYTTSDDITAYEGSAGGNSQYSGDDVWTELGHSWTFDSNGGARDSLVIEVRIYSNDNGNYGYVDDMFIDVFGDDLSGTVINTPAIPAPGALALLGLAGLARRRRR